MVAIIVAISIMYRDMLPIYTVAEPISELLPSQADVVKSYAR